jgi:hypothetical protein
LVENQQWLPFNKQYFGHQSSRSARKSTRHPSVQCKSCVQQSEWTSLKAELLPDDAAKTCRALRLISLLSSPATCSTRQLSAAQGDFHQGEFAVRSAGAAAVLSGHDDASGVAWIAYA